MMNKRIDLAREAAGVARYHTARLIHGESVGEHSFNVCNLILLMTNGEASRALLIAALTHDMGEPAVGDVPSPIKKMMPDTVKVIMNCMEEAAVRVIHPHTPTISDVEKKLLKLADNLDGLLKCRDELRLGNRNIRTIGDRYVQYIQELTEHWNDYRLFAEQCIYLYRKEL